MERPRTNAEIDELLSQRMPLIRQAARATCPHRQDELSHEIVLLWWERHLKNPAKWWEVLSDPSPAHVVRSCRQMALRVVEKWQRQEVAGELVEEAICAEVEWGRADSGECYAGTVGKRHEGNHIASDEEVKAVFALLQRHSALVEALDLWNAYARASYPAKQAIRLLASGYSRAEIGKADYMQAKKYLRSALA